MAKTKNGVTWTTAEVGTTVTPQQLRDLAEATMDHGNTCIFNEIYTLVSKSEFNSDGDDKVKIYVAHMADCDWMHECEPCPSEYV